MALLMCNTFNPEDDDDGNDALRWLHVECEEAATVSQLCGSGGGTGSDVKKSENMLKL